MQKRKKKHATSFLEVAKEEILRPGIRHQYSVQNH